MGTARKRLILVIPPVANLFQLTTGRTNELWNVAGLVALTLSLELTPMQADDHISSTVH